MAKTKISEFSSTPANNTDIDSINIAEGCAPSGINDAIRELMAQLKDFQTGAQGDSFNGPIGTSTAAAGAFTTLSATGAITSTLATGTAPLVIASTTKVANLNVDLLDGADWASPAALGSTTPAAVSATTLSASSTLSVTGAGSIQGLTVGRGAGAVSTNTAVGANALYSNTTGSTNTAVGINSGYTNTSGAGNSFFGRASGYSNSTGSANSAFGQDALYNNTTASNNTAVGYQAAYLNTTGYNNAAFGNQALYANTTGALNSAIGDSSLGANTTGNSNTAVGRSALGSNTTASNNTAVGYQAGYTNTTGQIDAFGNLALRANTTGNYSVAVGNQALTANTTGNDNSALGFGALYTNTTGSSNTAVGRAALLSNTTASNNTAVGYQAGYNATSVGNSVFIGHQAGYTGNGQYGYNTVVGYLAGYSLNNSSGAYGNTFVGCNSQSGTGAGYSVTTGTQNTILGGYSGNQGGLDIRAASNYIVLSDGAGNPRGIFDGSGNLLVGTTSQNRTGDRLSVTGDGTQVATFKQTTNTSGYSALATILQANANNTSSYHLWGNTDGVGNWYLYGNGTTSFSSDIRLKKNIVTARNGYIDDLCKLRVVKYNWKKDADGTPQELGLIAQEVEQVFAGLVQDDLNPVEEGGEIYKQVKQSVLPFMLLKAIQEQQAIINQLKARLDAANL